MVKLIQATWKSEAEGRFPVLKLPCWGSHICCWKAGCRGWNPEGCVASQWALSTNGAELSGVHELPEGEECGSYRCEFELSPSEGEEDSDFSLSGSHSQLDLTELCRQEESQEQDAQDAHRDGEDEAEGCSHDHEATLQLPAEASTPATIRKSNSDNRLQGKRPPRLLISSNNRVPLPPIMHGGARPSPDGKDVDPESAMFGECLDFCKRNLFAEDRFEDHYLDDLAEVPEELILSRINSKRAMRSYQLGKQLSFQWSTGAGARIGCVRDYPSELQFRALEEVSLSPRGGRPARFPSPRPGALTPNNIPAGSVVVLPLMAPA